VPDEGFAVKSLQQCALFADVEPAALGELAGAMVRRRFRRNE
jgi:hypothetical protein